MCARAAFHVVLGCELCLAAVGCLDSGSNTETQVSDGTRADTSSNSATNAPSTASEGSPSVVATSTTNASTVPGATHSTTTSETAASDASTLSSEPDLSGSDPTSSSNPANTSATGANTSETGHTESGASEASTDSSSDTNTTGSETATNTASDAGTAEECPQQPALTGGQEYCSNSKGNAGDGYGYELWAEGNGTGCMTVFGSDAAFKANWTNVEDFLARVGLDFDETRTHQQVGNIWAEFAETQTGSEQGLTYVGIYGWTVDPLREFYILDDWGTTKPAGTASDGTPRDEVGTLVVDGATYDVWKKTRENKPSIKGTTTFDQYFSIRRTARQCGRVSVTEHFAGWEDLGLSLGKLYEVKVLVESQSNSGSVEFSSASVRTQ